MAKTTKIRPWSPLKVAFEGQSCRCMTIQVIICLGFKGECPFCQNPFFEAVLAFYTPYFWLKSQFAHICCWPMCWATIALVPFMGFWVLLSNIIIGNVCLCMCLYVTLFLIALLAFGQVKSWQGSWCPILTKLLQKLPKDAFSYLTPSPGSSGTSMSSKTPGRDLEDRWSLDWVSDVHS